MRILMLLLLLAPLSGCGFSPVYGRHKAESGTIDLRSVKVASVPGRNGQLFTAELEDLMNPQADDVPADYELRTDLGVQLIPLTIDPDGTISSFRVLLNTTLILVDIRTGKEIHREIVKRSNRYSISDADYSSYVAREDAIARGLTELAREYFLRTAAFFSGYKAGKVARAAVLPDRELRQIRTPSIYDNRTTLNQSVPEYVPMTEEDSDQPLNPGTGETLPSDPVLGGDTTGSASSAGQP